MRSNLSSGFLKLLWIQTGAAFPPFLCTLPHKTCRWWSILCQAPATTSCPTLSKLFPTAFIPNCPLLLYVFWAVPTHRRIRSSLLKSTESKISYLQIRTACALWSPVIHCGDKNWQGETGVWSKLRLLALKESCWNNMVIYVRAWHTGSCLCIRKGPLGLLIPAETHHVIGSTFVQKKPPTWSFSPLCTFMCTVGDPSHQTQGQETSVVLHFLVARTRLPAPACAQPGIPWFLLDVRAKYTFPNLSQTWTMRK